MIGALSIFVWLSSSAHAEKLTILHPGWGAWRWTTEDGLPINNISAADITPDGLLWLATFDGLARFDGDQFEVFTPGSHPELPTSRFVDVRASEDGTIWAVSEGGLLAQFRDDRFRIFSEDEHALGSVQDLVQTSRGLLALGEASPARLDGSAIVPLEPVLGLPADNLPTTLFEQDGRLWVSTQQHDLLWLDEDASQWERWPEKTFKIWFASGAYEPIEHRIGFLGSGETIGLSPEGLRSSDGSITPLPSETGTMLWSEDGSPLVGTVDGLRAWDGTALVPAQQPGTEEWWVAGNQLHHGSELILEARNQIDVLTVSDDGTLWVREDGGGLILVSPVPVRTIQEDSLGEIGPVNPLLADRHGGLWIGTVLEPLRRHGKEDQLVLIDGEPIQHAQTLYEKRDGSIWVFSRRWGCVVREIPERGPIRCEKLPGTEWAEGFAEGFASAVEDRDGTLYLGGNHIVALAPDGSLRLALRQDGWHPVRDMIALPSGSVVATALGQGLYLLDGDEQRLRSEESDSPIRTVRALWLDAAGDLWLGTEGKGVCRLELSAEPFLEAPLVCVGVQQGLTEGFISSMVLDAQGRLWMSSNRGLQAVRFEDLVDLIEGRRESISALALGRKAGMLEPETNGVRKPSVAPRPDGSLCYPTMDGVACLDPAAAGLPPPPQVIPLELVSSTRSLPRGAPISLAADEREISARWTAAAFRERHALRFRYRLAGLDREWRGPTDRGEATWTNLPPGEYTLEIQSGWGEQWRPRQAIASISVPPTFTETLWFALLLAALGSSLLVGLFQVRAQRAREREAQLHTAVEAATAELLNRNSLIAAQADELVERNARIAAQTERLSQLDAARTRFVANISHELRTPLTLIRGTIEDLPASALPDTSQRGVAIALRNANRLGHLIDQLIDTARLEAGGVPLRAMKIDLPSYLRRITERFESELARREISLQQQSPPSLGVWLDPELMDKVLTNLLANAASYTPDGGWIRLVTTVGGDNENGNVEVQVTDSGPGVPEEVRAQLFERFYQTDSSDRRRRGGAGLGLSLAYDIVALHGGSISVDNVPEAGACFSVRLPLGVAHLSPDEISLDREDDYAPQPLLAEPPLQPMPTASDGSLPCALVVEDNPDMRAYIASHLSAVFAVVTAENGQDALDRLEAGLAPAVIVSDIMMPEVNGLTLCRRLRAEPRWSPIPIMLLSAKSTTQDRIDGLSLADDYLTKPFRAAEMVLRARKLAASPATAEPAPTEPEPEGPSPFLQRLEGLARQEMSEPSFGAKDLARRAALSPRQLLRRVRDEAGMTVSAWLREQRLREAQRLMCSGDTETVGAAAAAVGFSSAYLSRVYRDWAGHPPSDDLRR